MDTTLIKFITFFFVFFSVARASIQIKELQQIYFNKDKLKSIALFEVSIYTMVNVTTAAYSYFIMNSILISTIFVIFSIISGLICLVGISNYFKTRGEKNILNDFSLDEPSEIDAFSKEKTVETNENFIKTNEDYLENIDFSQQGDSKVDGFNWKSFKETNKESSVEQDSKVPVVNIPQVNSELVSNSVEPLESRVADIIEEMTNEEVRTLVKDTNESGLVEPLEEVIVVFNKDDANIVDGLIEDNIDKQETQIITDSSESNNVIKNEGNNHLAENVAANIPDVLENTEEKVAENSVKSDIIPKKKSGRKKKPKNGQ